MDPFPLPADRSQLKIPRTVWAQGFVCLLTNLSSEIIDALLPLFLTATLGASVALVGLIDGVAEATASIAKVFSVMCRTGEPAKAPHPCELRPWRAVEAFFPLAGNAAAVFGARFADRIGKGLRGAPRDAPVADVTPAEIRGARSGCASRSIQSARSRGRCSPST